MLSLEIIDMSQLYISAVQNGPYEAVQLCVYWGLSCEQEDACLHVVPRLEFELSITFDMKV